MKPLALILLATISDAQVCEHRHSCRAELTVDFRAEIKPAASLAWDVYDLGHNRIALDYTSRRHGIERRGVVLLVSRIPDQGELATLLLLDDLHIQTRPGVLAYRLPDGVGLAGVGWWRWRLYMSSPGVFITTFPTWIRGGRQGMRGSTPGRGPLLPTRRAPRGVSWPTSTKNGTATRSGMTEVALKVRSGTCVLSAESSSTRPIRMPGTGIGSRNPHRARGSGASGKTSGSHKSASPPMGIGPAKGLGSTISGLARLCSTGRSRSQPRRSRTGKTTATPGCRA
jgi:hypothetical protein